MLQMLATRARCRRVAKVLQSYLDGEVEPPTARAVAAHLEECRRCGLEASVYSTIRTAIAAGGAGITNVDQAAVASLTIFARDLAGDVAPDA